MKWRQEDASETEGKGLQNYGQTSYAVWATTRGQEARAESRSGVRSYMNTLEGQQESCKRPRKLPEKRLKWYGHVRRMKEEQLVRSMLDVDIGLPGKTRRERSNLR